MHKECPKCQQILDESVKNCPICSTNVSEIESIKTQEDLSPENDPVTPDPLSKDYISPNDSQRSIRAFEVKKFTKKLNFLDITA